MKVIDNFPTIKEQHDWYIKKATRFVCDSNTNIKSAAHDDNSSSLYFSKAKNLMKLVKISRYNDCTNVTFPLLNAGAVVLRNGFQYCEKPLFDISPVGSSNESSWYSENEDTWSTNTTKIG